MGLSETFLVNPKGHFEPLAREYLANERLAQALPEAAIEEPGLFLYFPRCATMVPKPRAFIDCAKEILHLGTR